MRGREAVLVLVTAVAGIALLAACSQGRTEGTRRQSAPAVAAAVGGPLPQHHRPPRREMDRLERPVADRLARRIAAEGLRLGYLDCPRWDGTVPSRMTCRAYVDGLVATVPLRLWAVGRGIGFDAHLGSGVVATRRLERTLLGQGFVDVDCGEVAAYPAQVGSRIVCRVHRGDRRSYVVATVRSRSGQVTIADLAPP